MRITKNPEERKQELIAAAEELFDRKGVEKTKISDIVQKVGVAQGLFYYYFGSKEEIVNAVIQKMTLEIEEATRRIREEKSLDFCGKISVLLDLFLEVFDRFLGDEEDSLHSLRQELQGNPMIRQSNAILLESLNEIVEYGVREKEIQLAYPQEMVRIFVSGLIARAEERLFSREEIQTMAEQILRLPAGSLKKRDIIDIDRRKEYGSA